MSYQFAAGAIFTCFLGCAFIYRSSIMNKITKALFDANPDVGRVDIIQYNNDKLLPEKSDKRDEVIIVGAGVAGSALAYALGKEGRRVHAIERDMTEPNSIVGEILQIGGYLKLVEMGLDDCLEGIDAQLIQGYALIRNGKRTILPYPGKYLNENMSGKSFHHGRFIRKMREKAAAIPNVKIEQGTVTSLIKVNGIVKGVTYKSKNNNQDITALAPLTIVADGCFSNLRPYLSKSKVRMTSNFLTFVLKNCELTNEKYANIILANPSPIWMYSISSNEVRCIIDIQTSDNQPSLSDAQMVDYLKNVIASEMPPTTREAFMSAIDKGIEIRKMQCGSVRAAPYASPGALLIGDALNARHPLSLGGMAVALSDVDIVCELLRPLGDLRGSVSTCKALEPFYTLHKPLAKSIDILTNTLQWVFCTSNDKAKEELQRAFFDYLSLGGIFNRGVIELVSGLNPQTLWWFPHSLAIVTCCFTSLLLPFPTPQRMQIAIQMLWNVSRFILHQLNH